MTDREHPEIAGLPILDQLASTPLHHVALSSFLPRAETLALMSSIAWAVSVGRASSQKGANECTISEDYSHIWRMRQARRGTPALSTLRSKLHKPASPPLPHLQTACLKPPLALSFSSQNYPSSKPS